MLLFLLDWLSAIGVGLRAGSDEFRDRSISRREFKRAEKERQSEKFRAPAGWSAPQDKTVKKTQQK